MIVVDASAMMRSLVQTDGTAAAVAVVERPDLIAPALIAIEIANALWRYVKAGTMTPDEAEGLLSSARSTIRLVQEDAGLVTDALALACLLRHPVYDCIYLALARRERAGLVTADLRMAERARQNRIPVELLP